MADEVKTPHLQLGKARHEQKIEEILQGKQPDIAAVFALGVEILKELHEVKKLLKVKSNINA